MIELCATNFPSSCTTSCFDGLGDYLEGQHWNLGGWGQILAYMAFCGFPGPVSWNSCCRRRLWIQGLHCFQPCWENQETQCRTGKNAFVSFRTLCFEFFKFVSRQPCFQHTACLLSSAGIRCAEACTKTWLVSLYWSNLSTHIALQTLHIISHHVISYHIMILLWWY